MYKKIGDICDLDENTVLLDICCGTGTIGLTLARVIFFSFCLFSFLKILKLKYKEM